MKNFLLLFAVLLATAAGAQTALDSLYQATLARPADTAKVQALLHLSNRYKIADQDTSLQLLQRARSLAEELGDPDKIIETYRGLGDHFHLHADYPQAKKLKLEALHLARERGQGQHFAGIFNELGLTYWRTGQLDSAYHYFTAAERAFADLGNPYRRWRVYLNLGRMYSLEGDLPQAKNYMEKAWAIVEPEGGRMDVGFVLVLLAGVYFELGDYEGFGEMTEKWVAFKAARPSSAKPGRVGEHSLFSSLLRTDDSTAEKLQAAIDYQEAAENPYRAGTLSMALGDVLAKNGQPEAALAAYQRAAGHLQTTAAVTPLRNLWWNLYQLQKERNETAAALANLERYHALNDSLRQAEVADNLRELEVKYETEKKEQALAIQSLDIQQKTFERNALLALLVLLAVLAFSLLTNYRNRLRTNKKLAAQQAELQAEKIERLEQEKKLTALNAVLEGQEQERSRIAHDLHDSLGGLLAAVKSHFNALPGNDGQPPLFVKTNQLIDEACGEVRRISHNMMPRALALSGLPGSLEDLAQNLRQQGLHCELEVLGFTDQKLPPGQALNLYRIIQELTHNVLKHANAQHLLLQVIRREGQLSVLVEDDGAGFEVAAALRQKGLGLSSIASRVKFLHGTITWDSVPGQGTTVSVEMPV